MRLTIPKVSGDFTFYSFKKSTILLTLRFIITRFSLRNSTIIQNSHPHLKGAPHETNRNVLQESARIARGAVTALDELDAAEFDALIVPGGFGAAKNLSDWALKGPDCTVDAQVEKVIKQFHTAKKPMGFCCIAPHLAAKVSFIIILEVGIFTKMLFVHVPEEFVIILEVSNKLEN